ncbi:NAD-dependent protein deacylase [Thermodesulfobacteriota bacterium]
MAIFTDLLIRAAKLIIDNQPSIALTGAGISVASGIPDFRGKNGLWSIYEPSEYATIDAFMANPSKVWNMLRAMDELISKAKPNAAHIGLGKLEKMGLLQHIITQNVDNLHQDGGSGNVIEFHGNHSTLTCLFCNNKYEMDEKRSEFPPKCGCGKILKPDVIFFGEGIPETALALSYKLALSAGVVLVIGTSAQVMPANSIPVTAARNNAKIIEINKEKTFLTEDLTDLFLEGDAGEIIMDLVEILEEMI